jgi:fatty acid desaturase
MRQPVEVKVELDRCDDIPAIELPTLAVALAVYACWGVLTWHYRDLPLWLFLPLAGLVGCWHGSLQHEVLHGHPTRWRWINELIAYPPIALWLPYPIYRDSHIAHHSVGVLTCPLSDPESYYLPADDWARLATTPWGRMWRLVLIANNTLIGRLTIGPAIGLSRFYLGEAKRLAGGASDALVTWSVHGALIIPVLWWVLAVCAIPFWIYAFGFAYAGLSLTMMRSFYEHRPSPREAERTAINEASWPWRLLYLNNSLHALHHERPTLAWYRLAPLYRHERQRLLADNGGFHHTGYVSLFRRFACRPKDSPCHPTVRRMG